MSEVSAMGEKTNYIIAGLNQLINRQLSPALVNPDYFNGTIQAAMADAGNKGIFPISNDIVSHWSSPMDIFFSKDEALFKVVVKVPAQQTRKSCGMFRLQPTPFSVSQ